MAGSPIMEDQQLPSAQRNAVPKNLKDAPCKRWNAEVEMRHTRKRLLVFENNIRNSFIGGCGSNEIN